MNLTDHNKKAWNSYVENKNQWTIPVSEQEINNARNGKWNIVLTPTKSIPHGWFPDLKGLKVLGLASGGGQQCPILAALGAEVTVFDNSENQLLQDKSISDQNGLGIKTVQGDMKDLLIFSDESFDLVFNPCSVVFVDDVNRVWKECFRVLKPNGILMTGLINPLNFQFEKQGDFYQLKYKQPYSDLNSLPEDKLLELINGNEALEFGHSLADQIGGQLDAGFLLTHMFEDTYEKEEGLEKYFPGFIATRAIKYPGK